MSKIDKSNLGYLGFDYQVRLMNLILTDKLFGESIIDIINPNYFEDKHLRIIAAIVKDAKEEHDIIPEISSIQIRLLDDISGEYDRKLAIRQLDKVKEANLDDTIHIQDVAMKFCKQQELAKSVQEIQRIIDRGNLDDYDKCEVILRQALEHGDNKDTGLNIFDGIENVLEDDFRNTIRTGIKGLDEVMNGGLAAGELAVILAPFGVGKTTMVTKLANTAVNDGKKVLQIFFEDNPKVIQRKHLSCWSGIDLNDLSLYKEDIMNMTKKMGEDINALGGGLKLRKFASDGTTIPMIRKYIRKLIAQGFKPDIVLLDYIDCVVPSKRFDDVNVGEGSVMREFETMLDELGMAGWTAVQGNRSSIKADVVEADQIGGSIKKGQIGHFIVSIAKSLDQKENGTATMAVLKSRFGKDGIIFEDIIFNNANIQIVMERKGRSHSEHKEKVKGDNQERINTVFDKLKTLKEEKLKALKEETLKVDTDAPIEEEKKDNDVNGDIAPTS